MSDEIREECGIALVRLKHPLSYYLKKYDTPLWGFYKLFLLMEKQHNRGQDGAGVGAVKLGMPAGDPYMFRLRQLKNNPLDRIFNKLLDVYSHLEDQGIIDNNDADSVKKHFEFGAEVYMGHLRYGTSGGYTIRACHPHFRKNNWPTRNLMLSGNFNLTNTKDLNQSLIERGQHPVYEGDTQTVMEEIGFHLDEEHTKIYREMRDSGLNGQEIADKISNNLDIASILKKSSQQWDGGYSFVGLIGNGDAFALRDPNGIRPLHYMEDDDVIAVASERGPLMTVFNKQKEDIKEVEPGSALIIKSSGEFTTSQIIPAKKTMHCSFERIYFSRGNDPDIYQERKAMGAVLSQQILNAIDQDLNHAVVSFIPNTAETAYYGLMDKLKDIHISNIKENLIQSLKKGPLDSKEVENVFDSHQFRFEKVTIKDIKLRTFISQEKSRRRLASHIYDISYGSVLPDDYLVCIDDSIVRGTTLKTSILKILARLNPKKIVIASTAPQIRYPDCYGIDMSEFGKFIAFQAAIALLKDRDMEEIVTQTYQACLEELKKPMDQMTNQVKAIYKPFSADEISKKISELVTPELDYWKGEVDIIFQTIENLHSTLTQPCGDWYFTGDFPTPGGFRVVNKSFVNYYENKKTRSY